MRGMGHGPVVYSRRHEPSVVVRTVEEDDVASGDEDSDGEFEFPFVSRESEAGDADELFAGGRIRGFYPVFGRVLLDEPPPTPAPRAPLRRLFQLEQARSSSVASTSSTSSNSSASTADAGIDAASPDSYCLWTPGSPASAASSPSRPPRKSGSTGSVARWRRIGELVVGRSQSDGKEKFLFLSAPPSPARDREQHSSPASRSRSKPPPSPSPKGSKSTTELDTVAAGRRVSYGGGATKGSTGGGRRTFLPYRQDLVGLFANVRGLSRSQHPF